MTDDFTQWRGPIAPPPADELADRWAVSQLVKVYALGIDMRDLETVQSVFAPDAMADGIFGRMPVSDYLPAVYAGAAAYASTQHNITNQYITVEGDDALVWSYAICYHLEEPGNGRDDLVVATQYRDRCHRFADGWLITARQSALQWLRGPYPRGEA